MCDEIYTKSITCDDIETTISLPSELPECKKSKTFEDNENFKQQAQEDLIEKMLEAINKINLSMDKELEQMNTSSMEELKLITKEMDSREREKTVSIEEAKALLKNNIKRYTQLATLVDEYDQDLKLLEKHRSDLIQDTVSSHLCGVNKSRPEDGQERFNNIVLHLNRNMLQNMQRNADLKLKLEIEGQEMLKKYQEKMKGLIRLAALEHAKHLWNLLKQKQNKRMVLDAVFSLSEENSKTREGFLQVTNSLLSKFNEFADVLELPGDCDMNKELWKQWIDTLNKKLELLSVLSKNVEGLMKSAVTTLLESFDEKVNLLNRTITPLTDSRQQETIKQSISVTNEIDELKAYQAEELQHLQNTWHNIIIALNKRTEHTKSFILDLTLIWTNHLSRVDTFQKGLDEALYTAKQQCEKQDKDKSTKLKSQIKSLREAKDLEKLNGQYNTLEKCFDDMSTLWIEKMQSSLKMIDDIKEKEIGPLVEEKKTEAIHFLQVKYPKRDVLSEKFSPKLVSGGTEFEKQIEMCNTYMTAIDNRTLGLYEMLERYLIMIEEAIREEINDCLEVTKIDTFNEYQNHISIIKELQTKTLQETKQIRYAELNVHSERLNSHSRAVKLVLEEINDEYNEIKLNQQKKLTDFREQITVASGSSLKTSWKLKNAINNLELEWNNLSESLLNSITDAKSRVEEKFKILQTSNDMFQKVPKTFNKGGNYSPEEIKILNRELKQLEKLLKSQQKSVINNFNGLVKDVSQTNIDDKLSGIKNQLETKKLEENITDILNIIRQRLRLEIKNVESSEKALGLRIKQLGTLQELDQQKINEIYEKASSLCNNLTLPPGVVRLECTNRMSTKSKPLESKIPSQRIDHEIDNTKLFINANETITTNGNSFLSCTKGLIFKKYNFLVKLIEDTVKMTKVERENKSKSTTSKKKKEPEKERLTGDITMQIESIKSTLLNYNMDCELFWLKKVANVLYHVNYFQSITNSLVENKLHSEHRNYIDGLKRLESSYKKKLQEHLVEGMKERNKTQKSLVLPLAHPTHHEKLNSLYNQVINAAQDQKSILEKEFICYKDSLQNHHENYVEKLKILKEILIYTQSRIHKGDIFEKLIADIKTVKEVLHTEIQVKAENDSDCKEVIEQSHTEIKTPIHENNYEKEKPKYPQSIWFDEDCSEENLTYTSSRCGLDGKSTNLQENFNNLSEKPVTININKTATNHLKQSTEEINTLFNDAK